MNDMIIEPYSNRSTFAFKQAALAFLRQIYTYLYTQILLQSGRFFFWSPVFLSLGIGVYYFLPFEPTVLISLSPFFFVCMMTLFMRQNRFALYVMTAFLLLPSLGFMLAKIHVMRIHTPMITEDIGPVTIQGIVRGIEIMKPDYDARIIISDLEVEGLEAEKTPRLVRLRLRKDYGLEIGQRISALAELMPLSGPSLPHGYDFRRHLYFQGIGAVGFIYSQVEILDPAAGSGFFILIEKARTYIGQSVYRALPKEQADIIAALINGQRAGISDEDDKAMRYSGLTHLLSISGLHITLVCGVIFFITRLFFAAWPYFALHYPIKKYCAILALLGGIIYMFLAGATTPTQRSVLMCCVIFMAIIFDRSPFSLRVAVFASLVVLAFSPFSLLSASFQLSFAAVVALVVSYDALRPYYGVIQRQSGWFRKALIYCGGVCLTSFIAGLATALFTLYHFQQNANYGILANMAAVPITAFWIMPLIVISVVAMPFGLETLPLQASGWGASWILTIAHYVADMKGAVLRIAVFDFGLFIFILLFLVLFILWIGSLRFVFAGIALLAFTQIFHSPKPDILVSSSHDLVAIGDGEKALKVNNVRKDKFTRENWESALGYIPNSSQLWPKHWPEECDDLGCRTTLKGQKIAYSLSPFSLREDCAWADILISKEPVFIECKTPIIIDKFDTHYRGAHSIFIEESGRVKILNVRATSNDNRPWGMVYE